MEEVSVNPFLLQPNGSIPNNPKLPALLYQQVFTNPQNLEQQFKKAFALNGWGGTWTNSVFDYHHYHSTSHEVLGVAAGKATLVLGGPNGKEVQLQAGDAVVLPAGTGHCRQHASADFSVVGAYPPGQENYDSCTAQDDPTAKQRNIDRVALPATDPVLGKSGPLLRHWQQKP
ncbi:cupin domain-containing protein [Pontibacter sp. CAU 1760]